MESIEIRSSWDMLTDTATLLLPKKISYFNALNTETKFITGAVPISLNTPAEEFPVFLQGDKTNLSGGYGVDVPLIFSGYIRAVAPNHPIHIDFEDSMYLVKNKFIEKESFKSEISAKGFVTLLEVIQFITEGINIKLNVVDGVKFGNLRISSSTASQVLDHIKKQYGLVSWFRGDTLNVGLAYLSDQASEVLIHRFFASGEDVNIISTDQLEYKTEDQVRIKLKMISIYPDNTKEEVIVGDLDGELRTAYQYDVPVESMEKMATEMLNKMVYEGYVGYFTTFLLPLVSHGDAVKLSDPEFPDREGTYLVKEVIYNYGVDGGRQRITLDRKIA
jgi:hypothetical protein